MARTWLSRPVICGCGRGIHAFTPGILVAAVDREAANVAALAGGGLVRAGTRHTAWTQHCLCTAHVPKQLHHRRHTCPQCGLTGDRDLVAALVGAHTVLSDPAVPGTARVDWVAAQTTLATHGVDAIHEGLQGALPESTGHHRPDRHPTSARPRRPQRSTSHPRRPEPACSANSRNDALDNPGPDPHPNMRDHTGTTRRTTRTVPSRGHQTRV
ncbi:zinc ribbon domain-containing protein [Dactylosporangium sp. CA-233914]|uniref:zinc ribbon domain-containing protein n=1 Tax=Dactylosporangium sp. CA-233914 TaxID=3239934 RepID=UPI003D8D56E1